MILPGNKHCEAGHPDLPPLRIGEVANFSGLPPIEQLSGEIDELFGTRPDPENSGEHLPDVPSWRLRTAALSALAAAGTDGAILAGGVHSPIVLSVLGLIAAASPAILGFTRHRDRVSAARESALSATREAERLVQLDAIATSLEQVATELEVISTTTGAPRDEARGRLEAMSVHTLREALTEGSKVVLFRLRDGVLRPSLVQEGWHRRPKAIPLDSELGSTISELAEGGRCLLLSGAAGEPDRIICPIVSGNSLFGVMLAESSDGRSFDAIDTDLVAGYSRLVGLGLGVGRVPFVEATSEEHDGSVH